MCVYILYIIGFLFLRIFLVLSKDIQCDRMDPQACCLASTVSALQLYLLNCVYCINNSYNSSIYLFNSSLNSCLTNNYIYQNRLKPLKILAFELCMITNNSMRQLYSVLMLNCLSVSHNLHPVVLAIRQQLKPAFACCCPMCMEKPNHIDD